MSKFACGCGHIINLSNGWPKDDLALIPGRTIETVGDALENGDLKSADDFYSLVDQDKVTVYRCPECQRLHVEFEPGKFTSYVAE